MIDGFPAFAPSLAREGSGYDPGVFESLAELEAENFWFTGRNALITWAIRRHLESPRSIFEIGCGTGFVLRALAETFPQADLTGGEIFIDGLKVARSRVSRAELIQLDARDIPFVGSFDVVGAFDVLEHINEDTVVLEQIHQALVPGGLIVIAVPQHPWLWSPADEHAHHVRRYTAVELRAKLEETGFEVMTSTSYMTLLLPLQLWSRRRQGRRTKAHDPLAELRLPGPVNRLLAVVFSVERALIRRGLRLPIGGSRLIVARRLGP